VPRILIVTTIDRTLAGHVFPYLGLLKDMGIEIELACRSVSKAATARLDSLGLPRHEVAFSRNPLHPGNIRALWQLRSILRRGRYDVADVHTPVAAWVARLAVRLFSPQTTVIYSSHGLPFHSAAPPLRNLAILLLERLAGRWTDYLVVINREDEQAAIRYGLSPPGRVRYMPGIGVDTAEFDPGAVDKAQVHSMRRTLGLTEEDVLFLSIAEFTPRKRQADILRALARLEDPRVHVAFAGIGRLMDRARSIASELGVNGRTHFLGYRSDVPVLIRASRSTVLTSEAEGVPKSLMESLSLEVPAIGTQVRGTQELLQDGCGLLVPLGDLGALAGAMRWMAEHAAEAVAMGRKGRRKILEIYDLRRALDLKKSVYVEALGLKVNEVMQ
jgi:glycosyltransferase involved in cell wall biosynthesis